ncbi:hypothetical protein B0H14DRAFT_3662490 [Mycena olivaceomarginata]|nr:hypothetical protein B0H14DRAFT_3662490 [Mycena olivaceomarginata]
MIVTQDEAFSIVEKPSSIRLLKYLRPSIKDSDIPTRKTIRKYILTLAEDRPNDWEIITEELAFMKIEGRHTGANLGSAILKILDRYGLRGKSGWITSDGASGLDQRDNGWTALEHDMMCIEHAVNIAAKHFVQTVAPTPQKSLQKKLRNGELDEDEVGKLLSTLGDGSDTPESDAESEDDEWTTGDAVGKVLALIKQIRMSPQARAFLKSLLYPGGSLTARAPSLGTNSMDVFIQVPGTSHPLRNKFYRDYTLSKREWEKIQIIHDALRVQPSRARELRQCGVPKGRGNANIISILLPVLPDLATIALMKLTLQTQALWVSILTSQLHTGLQGRYDKAGKNTSYQAHQSSRSGGGGDGGPVSTSAKNATKAGASQNTSKLSLTSPGIVLNFLSYIMSMCLGVQATKTKVLRGILKFESSAAYHLLSMLCHPDPTCRATIADATKHPWFQERESRRSTTISRTRS